MNILLTCAGRRNYLVRYFREALSGKGTVYAVDSSRTAPALHEADQAFIVPSVSEPSYIDVLTKICRKHNIKLIFSLNDLELPLLAREKNRFLELGALPVVSEAQVVDLCFDKWATDQFLAGLGIDRPRTYLTLADAMHAVDSGELDFPVVVKPRLGTASILIDYPQSLDELELTFQLNRLCLKRTILAKTHAEISDKCGLLIQEKLSGEEYGLDIVNDLNGRYVTTFVKLKLAMRSGETDKARTVAHEGLVALGRTIGEALGHVGNLDCDVFVSGGKFSVLEMNPRFGGGYPFSHVAGANLPAAFIAWAEGATPRSEWLQITPGVASAKCDRLVEVSRLVNHESKSSIMPLRHGSDIVMKGVK
jgi:carbamoyl-phosphate synthase large subunit